MCHSSIADADTMVARDIEAEGSGAMSPLIIEGTDSGGGAGEERDVRPFFLPSWFCFLFSKGFIMIKYSTEIIMGKVFGMFMLGPWLFTCKKNCLSYFIYTTSYSEENS